MIVFMGVSELMDGQVGELVPRIGFLDLCMCRLGVEDESRSMTGLTRTRMGNLRSWKSWMSRGGLDRAGARGDQGVHAGSYGMESWRLTAWSFGKTDLEGVPNLVVLR